MFADYHNHPLGHDPERRYSVELLRKWADAASSRGLTDVAFTDHDRYHSGVEPEVFREFAAELPAGTKFRLGIELDNDPETSLAGHRWTERHYQELDFVLGSVHFIDEWPFDHPAHKDEFRNWDINDLYRRYFREIQRTARSELVDGMSHLDLIKIFGYRPTDDLSGLYEETLDVIAESGKTVEISTAGLRKPVGEIYPADQILAMVKSRGIAITIASDAHGPEHLGENYDSLRQTLDRHGFQEITVFDKHKPISVSIV